MDYLEKFDRYSINETRTKQTYEQKSTSELSIALRNRHLQVIIAIFFSYMYISVFSQLSIYLLYSNANTIIKNKHIFRGYACH
jgi:hypothetical protein